MTNENTTVEELNPRERLVPLLVSLVVVGAFLLIPLRIISRGYAPGDDALRHAAKVISEKSWDEILVLREGVGTDSHPGWHVILHGVKAIAGENADVLVVAEVVIIFFAIGLLPIVFLRRKEAWGIAFLIAAAISQGYLTRFLLGRPFVVTSAVFAIILLTWQKFRERETSPAWYAVLTALTMLSVWIHGSWFLYAFPVLVFLLAREWRACVKITACIAAGSVIGILASGHPIALLRRTWYVMFNSPDQSILPHMLVTELQPRVPNAVLLVAVALFMLWRALRGEWSRKKLSDPVLIAVGIGYALAYFVGRFWHDWGFVALLVWFALEVQDVLERETSFCGLRRLVVAVIGLGALTLMLTSNVGGRWTETLTQERLDYETASEEEREWYPEPGGIVYSNSMTVFYNTFFANPHAPWRYILGFESSLMPPEHLDILRNIQWNFGAYEAMKPWIEMMRPEDRLILKTSSSPAAKLSMLEWYEGARNTWIGRLPRSDFEDQE